jgi:F0F1-type ATP synthase membrane subunit b/b'
MFSHIQEDIKPAREGLLEFNKALQDYQQELRNTHSTDDS